VTEHPIEATLVPAPESQGCVKVLALTAARIIIHLVVFSLVVLVLVSNVGVFTRFFEQENLKLPAITVLIINLSYRMKFHGYVIVPALLLIDASALLLLQLPSRPWRFLARIWFSGVLVGASMLLAIALVAMSIPIDTLLPPDQQLFPIEPPAEDLPAADNP
jgi:hypothetical protein